MYPRKYQQLKTYSKIMRKKKKTGQIQQYRVPIQGQSGQGQQNMKKKQQKIEKIQKSMVPEGEEPELNEQDFQDQFSDEYDEEQAWISDSSSQENEQEGGDQGTMQSQQQSTQQQKKQKQDKKQQTPQVFIGTNKNLKKGQVLDFDNNAYDMLHRLNIQWPCLSIDFICRDTPFISFQQQQSQYQIMKNYPYEVYTVQGSSNNTKNNSIYLTKWTKLHKTKYDDDPEGEQEQEMANNDDQPQIIAQQVQTTYSVNRIRALNNSPIVAFWNEAAQIHIMDMTKNYEKLKNNISTKKRETCQEIVMKSENQGFGLCWNPHKVGQLCTGNVLGHVQIFQNNENYTSWSKSAHYKYHHGSVQDIVYSPSQPTVLATCSSDGTLQVVDLRQQSYNSSQLCIKAHTKDVNVCDWNKQAKHLIVTGSDDCSVKVWDLRMTKKNKSISEELLAFKWHSEPISSIRFQPNQQSVIAVASQDNSISIWDMAMQNQQQDPQIPNQLMFIHQGQQQIKQLCFHPIYYEMIISSASDGINIFKPSYEMPEEEADMKQDLKRPPIKEQELDDYIKRLSIHD